jgi:hypothetical protein
LKVDDLAKLLGQGQAFAGVAAMITVTTTRVLALHP